METIKTYLNKMWLEFCLYWAWITVFLILIGIWGFDWQYNTLFLPMIMIWIYSIVITAPSLRLVRKCFSFFFWPSIEYQLNIVLRRTDDPLLTYPLSI